TTPAIGARFADKQQTARPRAVRCRRDVIDDGQPARGRARGSCSRTTATATRRSHRTTVANPLVVAKMVWQRPIDWPLRLMDWLLATSQSSSIGLIRS